MSSGSDAKIVQLPASSSTAPASSSSTSGVTVASSSTSRGNATEPSKPKQAPYMNDKIPAYPVFNGQVVIVNDDGDFLARRPAEKTPVLPFLCAVHKTLPEGLPTDVVRKIFSYLPTDLCDISHHRALEAERSAEKKAEEAREGLPWKFLDQPCLAFPVGDISRHMGNQFTIDYKNVSDGTVFEPAELQGEERRLLHEAAHLWVQARMEEAECHAQAGKWWRRTEEAILFWPTEKPNPQFADPGLFQANRQSVQMKAFFERQRRAIAAAAMMSAHKTHRRVELERIRQCVARAEAHENLAMSEHMRAEGLRVLFNQVAKRGEVPEKVNGEPVRLDRNICEKCTIHPREKWFRFVSTVANVNHAKCKNKTGKHSESIEIKRTNCPRFKFVDTPFGQVPGYPYWLCSYSKLEHLHELSQHSKCRLRLGICARYHAVSCAYEKKYGALFRYSLLCQCVQSMCRRTEQQRQDVMSQRQKILMSPTIKHREFPSSSSSSTSANTNEYVGHPSWQVDDNTRGERDWDFDRNRWIRLHRDWEEQRQTWQRENDRQEMKAITEAQKTPTITSANVSSDFAMGSSQRPASSARSVCSEASTGCTVSRTRWFERMERERQARERMEGHRAIPAPPDLVENLTIDAAAGGWCRFTNHLKEADASIKRAIAQLPVVEGDDKLYAPSHVCRKCCGEPNFGSPTFTNESIIGESMNPVEVGHYPSGIGHFAIATNSMNSGLYDSFEWDRVTRDTMRDQNEDKMLGCYNPETNENYLMTDSFMYDYHDCYMDPYVSQVAQLQQQFMCMQQNANGNQMNANLQNDLSDSGEFQGNDFRSMQTPTMNPQQQPPWVMREEMQQLPEHFDNHRRNYSPPMSHHSSAHSSATGSMQPHIGSMQPQQVQQENFVGTPPMELNCVSPEFIPMAQQQQQNFPSNMLQQQNVTSNRSSRILSRRQSEANVNTTNANKKRRPVLRNVPPHKVPIANNQNNVANGTSSGGTARKKQHSPPKRAQNSRPGARNLAIQGKSMRGQRKQSTSKERALALGRPSNPTPNRTRGMTTYPPPPRNTRPNRGAAMGLRSHRDIPRANKTKSSSRGGTQPPSYSLTPPPYAVDTSPLRANAASSSTSKNAEADLCNAFYRKTNLDEFPSLPRRSRSGASEIAPAGWPSARKDNQVKNLLSSQI